MGRRPTWTAIREAAEATSKVAKLLYIDTFLVNKFAYLRFNYSTGDAAGQNMVGRATFAACSWILEQHRRRCGSSTSSRTSPPTRRRRRSTSCARAASASPPKHVPRNVLIEVHAGRAREPGLPLERGQRSAPSSPAPTTTARTRRTASPPCSSPRARTSPTSSESSAGILYTEITPSRDLYISITIPSLIVATHGGGTGAADAEASAWRSSAAPAAAR